MATLTAWRIRHPGTGYDKEPPEIWEVRQSAMRELGALKAGDIDPWLNRTIRALIRKSTRFIVYLDEDFDIQWWWLFRPKEIATVGLVQARVSQLVHESSFLLLDNDLRMPLILRLAGRRTSKSIDLESAESIRSQLAEAVAQAIEGGALTECERTLAEAEKSILIAKDQICRPTFFWSFFFSVALVAAVVSLLWELDCSGGTCGHRFLFNWAEAALAGSFGALVSAMLRTNDLRLEPRAARRGIRIDAIARALIGSGAGIVMSFAYDSGLVLRGVMPQGNEASEAARLFLCLVAGISERLLPSLVGRAESLVEPTTSKDKPQAASTSTGGR